MNTMIKQHTSRYDDVVHDCVNADNELLLLLLSLRTQQVLLNLCKSVRKSIQMRWNNQPARLTVNQ